MKKYSIIAYCLFLFSFVAFGQKEQVKNQPYADMKLVHLGFHVGLHTQDLILTNSGTKAEGGDIWFGGIPSYSPGFSVGIVTDLFMNPYCNLRFTPTINFGDKEVYFKGQFSGDEYKTNIRSSYLSFPLEVKYSSFRLNNYRPYVTGGVYGAIDLGRKKSEAVLLKPVDYGISFGFGCNFYLPYFKLCPEIKFCFGLNNLIEKDRSDLTPQDDMYKFKDVFSKATSRMIVFTFNFE